MYFPGPRHFALVDVIFSPALRLSISRKSLLSYFVYGLYKRNSEYNEVTYDRVTRGSAVELKEQ